MNVMDKDEKEPEEGKEEYSTKDELKEEGSFFVKDIVSNTVKAGSRLGRGVIQVLRHHPKVEDLEEQVEAKAEELKELEQDE